MNWSATSPGHYDGRHVHPAHGELVPCGRPGPGREQLLPSSAGFAAAYGHSGHGYRPPLTAAWPAGRLARQGPVGCGPDSKHAEQALRELRRAAYSGSRFYRKHHAGLLEAPLEQLPTVTKSELMANFDQAVTVPGLRLADVDHLQILSETDGDPGVPWKGRWWAAAQQRARPAAAEFSSGTGPSGAPSCLICPRQ